MKKCFYALVVLAIFLGLSGIFVVSLKADDSDRDGHSNPIGEGKIKKSPEELKWEKEEVEKEKTRRLNAAREYMRKSTVPIDFYGIVLDQDQKPIAGAKVKANISLMKEPIPGLVDFGFDYLETVSGADGTFMFKGYKGDGLGIKEISKNGFLLSSKSANKHYAYFEEPGREYKPDPKKPEVFRMWKQMPAEKLVDGKIRADLENRPEFKTFNLFTGREDPDGDLKVKVYSTPRIPPKWDPKDSRHPQEFRRETLSWNADIEVVDGGIQEMADDELRQAPEAGYKSKWSFHQPVALKRDASKGEAPWRDRKTVNLFIHCRGKYYGRMTVELSMLADAERPDRSSVQVEYFMNPSGSRNLEYDSKQKLDREWYRQEQNITGALEAEKKKRRQELKENAAKKDRQSP